MIARRADFFLGLAAVAVALGYHQVAVRIPQSLLSDAVGADGVPRVLGWAMGILGVLLCLRSLGRAPAATGEEPTLAQKLQPHVRALGLLAILVAYVLLAPWLGYGLATGLLVAASAAYAGAAPGRHLLLVAVVAGAGFWVLFVHVFGIAMPPGTLFER